MIEITEKSKCTGCTACKSICPQKCIKMVADEEGFLYPQVDKKKCIRCNLCEKVCPVLHVHEYKKDQKAYIFQHKDNDIRRQSTSGGAFTAIAEYVLNQNGIVYGAMFDDKFKVIHNSVEKAEDLYKFRNSKYVQSELGESFTKVKAELENGRYVCFSGTSCQIEGLKKFLNKEYEKLLLVDVVCRAVPSPLVWQKYLNIKKKENSNIKDIRFRDKFYGYKYSNFTIFNKENKITYHEGIETDQYLRAFFSNICDRPSCYECVFKKQNRESDITIWDCFEVEKYNKTFDDDKGTTRVLTHTKKGNNIIKEIAKTHKVNEIDVEKSINNFLAMFQPIKKNNKREQFFKDINTLDEETVFKKYFPITLKVRFEKYGRLILLKTGIYKKILKLGKKIRKRD